MKSLVTLTILICSCAIAPAQDAEYDVPWSSLSNGGDLVSESENFRLMATVGQPAVALSVETDDYSVGSGFWYAVWTVYAPSDYFGSLWAWPSISIHPMDPDPCTLFGFDCGGRVWAWDKYGKYAVVHQPPFNTVELEVGEGYLVYSEVGQVPDPSYYSGFVPPSAYENKLGRMGWTWVGMPGLWDIGYPDFMSNIAVRYDQTGEERTAQEDYDAIPDNWVSWGWAFWDAANQYGKTFTPYAPFGNNVCYPWVGYRVWVQMGSATDEDDPDQVVLIWP